MERFRPEPTRIGPLEATAGGGAVEPAAGEREAGGGGGARRESRPWDVYRGGERVSTMAATSAEEAVERTGRALEHRGARLIAVPAGSTPPLHERIEDRLRRIEAALERLGALTPVSKEVKA